MPRSNYDLTADLRFARKPRLLIFVVQVGIAATALTLGVFFLVAPEQATQAAHEVVQAAESMVKKDWPKKVAQEAKAESNAVPLSRRRVRQARLGPQETKSPEPSQTPMGIPHGRRFATVNVRLGTERATVREMFGKPDLAVYALERGHVMEQFVYLGASDATSVLLMDGRVASVSVGMPSFETASDRRQ